MTHEAKFQQFRLSYLSWQSSKLKTVTGYFEEDVNHLIKESERDKGFVAIVREAVFSDSDGIRVIPVNTIHGAIPGDVKPDILGYRRDSKPELNLLEIEE
jgi:hypothetical protein